MLSEKDKCRAGELYDANHDRQLIEERLRCKRMCFEYNRLEPGMAERREEMLRDLLGKTGENFLIEQPFLCDYGYNIEIGENFYSNVNCVILDEASARISIPTSIASFSTRLPCASATMFSWGRIAPSIPQGTLLTPDCAAAGLSLRGR